MRIILLVIPACLLVMVQARRVQNVRSRVEQPQVYYVDEDGDSLEDDEAPVAYQPRTRALPSPRSKDTSTPSKAPPVQTIRNYNKVNDDGSFTFGYEAADGSFKEETRGTDCVVRGKYGYIDPDGNKREFTYVSGNPCDPNAPKDDDDEPTSAQREEEASGPANYPSVRPVPRPARPTYAPPATTRAPPTTVFQSQYQLEDEDESQELEDVRPRPQTVQQRRPHPSVSVVTRRPQLQQVTQAQRFAPTSLTSPQAQNSIYEPTGPRYQVQTTASPLYRTAPTTSSLYRVPDSTTLSSVATYRPSPQSAVAITPRPHASQPNVPRYTVTGQTERPGVVFAPSTIVQRTTSTTPASALRTSTGTTTSNLNYPFNAGELDRYPSNAGLRPQAPPSPAQVRTGPRVSANSEPIYQSELVYDPATGQYNTQLYQTLPQTVGDFSLNHKLQPFLGQQQSPNAAKFAQSTPQFAANPSSAPPQTQEAIFRQQQAQLFQQSQQLYAQQQNRQQQPHRFQALESQQDSQPFYYISPTRSNGANSSPLSIGQIDQFLRGAANGF